ncbi:MAG: hypothetical protein WC655_12700 [Candidatus Hydrogenedentales bacterium]|jgi:hypothetical protein
MKFRFSIRFSVVVAAIALSAGTAGASELTVGDAYARDSGEGLVWTIGTKAIEITFDGRDSMFRLVSFVNKTCEPPLEYVEANTAAAPFALDSESAVSAADNAESQWALKTAAAQQVATGGCL